MKIGVANLSFLYVLIRLNGTIPTNSYFLCFGSEFTESVFGSRYFAESGLGSKLLLNPNPIRIQTKIFYEKMINTFTIRKFSHQKLINVFLVPTKDVQALQAWNFFIFSSFGGNFCLPGSGSGFPIRIRWLNWIRIQSGTLCICHFTVITAPFLAYASNRLR